MRMERAPQACADLSTPTRRARAIRVLSNALSTQASEHKLEPQLNATRVVRPGRPSNLAEGGGRRVRIVTESVRAVGIGKPDTVESVDELRPELQTRRFSNYRVLNDREVEVVLPWIAYESEPVWECPDVAVKTEPQVVPEEADWSGQ